MNPLQVSISKFLKREDGPTAVEYAVMLALIIAVCTATISALGGNASGVFNESASAAAPGNSNIYKFADGASYNNSTGEWTSPNGDTHQGEPGLGAELSERGGVQQ